MAQSQADCATILKRGYLADKRGGFLDRKRWYVLRRDLAQGYCVLEFYKDEKSASKGEPPKGFINVHDVVEVQRVSDKKQTFEILCPGVGHRLSANSEVETDEWVAAVKKLILYKKRDVRTVTAKQLPPQARVPRSQTQAHPHTAPLSTSPPSHAPSHSHSRSHTLPISHPHSHQHPPQSLTIPRTTDAPLSHSPSRNFSHSLPTPPEHISSPPIPVIQRQKSSEFVPPLPSPPTSSDSSSACSGSIANFDTQTHPTDGEAESSTRFRVHVKESDKLSVSGTVDLVIAEDSILLHSIQTGEELVSWPFGSLRRYGVNSVCFTIITGRYCNTGEGRFQFYTPQSRFIHSKVHSMVVQKASQSQSQRRASEPITNTAPATRPHLQHQPHSHPPPPHLHTSHSHSPPSTSSPYTHIEHALRPSTSQEQYDKLHTPGTLVPASYSKLNHGKGTLMMTNPISIPHSHPHIHSHTHTVPTVHLCSRCTSQSMHNMTGQLLYLSSSPPTHSHVYPSLSTSPSRSVTHTIVTSYSPSQQQNPPLGILAKNMSTESSCPDFSRYEGGGSPKAKLRSRSITSTLM